MSDPARRPSGIVRIPAREVKLGDKVVVGAGAWPVESITTAGGQVRLFGRWRSFDLTFDRSDPVAVIR